MKIYQLVHTLSYGDAISGEVLALQRCFRSMGAESEIFAINVHPYYKDKAHDYRELDSGFMGEVVLHYSLGSPLNDLYSRMKLASRNLIYHNLTPSKWFEGINPRIVSDIEGGLKELPALCRETDRLIADSQFNATELRQLGFQAVVLPLPLDPEKWNIERNEGIHNLLAADKGIHVLHIGRMAPNKCLEDIVKIFYFLHHHINRKSKLWLAGTDIDTELYSFSIKRLIQELKLDHCVQCIGSRADSEIRALYEGSTVYLCMSEHEGFCLPVIEAMNFGLPVIAYGSSALPETVGNGGIVVYEKRIAEVAELIDQIASDSTFRNELVRRGKERAQEFSFEKFEKRVRELFAEAPRRAAVNV